MRKVGSRQAERQLLAAQTQAFYPVGSHCVEVRWIGVRFFAAHQISRRIWKIPVRLAEIGKNEVLDLPGALHLVQSVDRGVLRTVEQRAEDARHPREQELARRL